MQLCADSVAPEGQRWRAATVRCAAAAAASIPFAMLTGSGRSEGEIFWIAEM
jgi:hypothetical protein